MSSQHDEDRAFDAVIGVLEGWVPATLVNRVALQVIDAMTSAGVDVVLRLPRTECRGSATGLHFFPEAECTRCGATS